MNIREFKIGSIVTRTELARNNQGEIDIDEELAGIELMGDRLKLESLFNGVILLSFDGGNVKLPLSSQSAYDWTEGWDYYKGPEIDPPVRKSDQNWFYAGLAIYVLLMVSFCALDVPNIAFYSLLGIGMAGLTCFGMHITKLNP